MFTEGGELIFEYGSMNKAALINVQLSLQMNHGCVVIWTTDLADTAKTILTLYEYTQRESGPSSLTARNGQRWGDLSSEAFSAFLIESVPGVGPNNAQAIVTALGGSLPISWHGTREELLKIPGIGPSTADNILKAFGGNAES
jgi:ERCC4-type nuclease